MCEIISANGSNDDALMSCAKTMYESNSDGLGIVAVYTDGNTFDYEIYKAETPEWSRVKEFFQNRNPWRFVVHARLATAGGVGHEETHPIRIIDDDVGVQYVLHNGHVQDYALSSEHRTLTSKLKHNGHVFNTAVDSELIAHAHGRIPKRLSDDSFDEPNLSGTLNYFLFSKHGILVRDTGKYHLTDEMHMTCRQSWIGDAEKFNGYRLYYPDGSYDQTEAEVSGYGNAGKSTTYIKGSRGRYRNGEITKAWNQMQNDDSDGGDDDSDFSSSGYGGLAYDDAEGKTNSKGHERSYEKEDGEDNIELKEKLMQNPPDFWHYWNEGFYCDVHRESFTTHDVCTGCVESFDEDDIETIRNATSQWR
jgi:predicted glutamine amidotransferase